MTTRVLSPRLIRLSTLAALLCCLSNPVSAAPKKQTKPGPAPKTTPGVRFAIRCLAVDSCEACAVADVNKDGKLDIIAGRNWYAAPDFVPRPVRLIEDWKSYTGTNGDHACDVDGDGWVDVIAGGFMDKLVHWYRNPGKQGLARGRLWEKKLLVDTGMASNEFQMLHDLDGDGRPEYLVNCWNAKGPMLAWQLAPAAKKGEWTMTKLVIGAKACGHGMGFGDVNGDGREDILVGTGWYERPAAKNRDLFAKPWTFHADWNWHAACPMLVRDLNGDGRSDLLDSNSHGFGLYWREQLPPKGGKTQWKTHLIDDSWSQPHCLVLADLDGDGQEDLVTGKRVRAHDGKDPGGTMPPGMYYYTWDKTAKAFTRHIIDQGHVGGGLQIQAADLNGDGRIDLAVAGKSGTYLLLNQGK